MKGKILTKFAEGGLGIHLTEEQAMNCGLGDIGKEILRLYDTGEINDKTNVELQNLYMSMVEITGNKKVIKMTKISVMKMTRAKLLEILLRAGQTAVKYASTDDYEFEENVEKVEENVEKNVEESIEE